VDVIALTSFLAPFLASFLTRTGEAAAAGVSHLGEAAASSAAKLWHRLAPGVEERPAAAEAAADVAAAPDNEGARGALAWQLEKLLAADPALRDDITAIWSEAVATGAVTVTASGERAVAVGRDVTGTIHTGDTVAGDVHRRSEPH